MTRRVHFVGSTLAAALLVAAPAFAGPPLLCFPFDIGSVKSLPMGAAGWESVDRSYNPSRLVEDTLALLTPQAPVVVRMETLRRATIYAMKSPKLADALLDALEARASSRSDANVGYAVFDFGYAAETYKQAGWMPGGREQAADARHAIARADDIDGYMLVTKARTLTGDQSMSFALVALGIDKKHGVDALRASLADAREAAKTDHSVRANLETHWAETTTQFR